VCVYICVCIYIYMCVCIYICVCVCVCVCVYIYMCVYVYIYMCVCVCVYIYVCVCIYIYIYTHIYTESLIMHSGITKIDYKNTAGHAFTKPVQIEGTTEKIFFRYVVFHCSSHFCR
jgi:hypothetical protein